MSANARPWGARLLVGLTILSLAGTASSGCNSNNGCEAATESMQKSIRAVCDEPAYVNSPFCQCCVPNGYFSIDDTCTCKPLVFNADFCWYEDGDAGYPAVRVALSQAANVCQERAITVPYVDVNTAACPTHVILVNGADGGDDGAPASEAGPDSLGE